MAFTWTVRDTGTTGVIGHSFAAGGILDTYGNTRFYTSFDLTSYADADITIYGPTADGSLTRTEQVVSGVLPSAP